MPFNPDDLPDLRGDYETPDQKLKRQLDELAGLLGPGFSFKNGLNYQNGGFSGNLSNKGIGMKYQLFGGELKGSVTDLGSGDPFYSLKFRKFFR